MGYIYQLSCNHCEYQKSFHLGSGIHDWKLDSVLSHFSPQDADSLEFLCNVKQIRPLSFRYELGKCRICGKFDAIPVFSFSDGTDFTGSRCGCDSLSDDTIELISTDPSLLPDTLCPFCQHPLAGTRTGFWD